MRRINDMAPKGVFHVGQSVRDSGGARVTIACVANGQVWAFGPRGLVPIRPAAEDECETGAPVEGDLPKAGEFHTWSPSIADCGTMGGSRSPWLTHVHRAGLDTRQAA